MCRTEKADFMIGLFLFREVIVNSQTATERLVYTVKTVKALMDSS